MLTAQAFDALLSLHFFSADDTRCIGDSGQFFAGQIRIHRVQIANGSSRFDDVIAGLTKSSATTRVKAGSNIDGDVLHGNEHRSYGEQGKGVNLHHHQHEDHVEYHSAESKSEIRVQHQDAFAIPLFTSSNLNRVQDVFHRRG